MTLAGDLHTLQELDTAIDQRQARLDEIRARAEESEEIDAAREELEGARVGLPELEPRQRDLELHVASIREKAAGVESTLYGGEVRNPKELTDLQLELEALTRQRAGVEEELLGVLEQLESKRLAVGAATERLTGLETAWTDQRDAGEAEAARLESELAALRERRAAQTARIPPAPVVTYDRLRGRRRGIAVVKVERGVCLGCRLMVPPAVLQRARSGMNPTPVQCPSCERMLYVV